jgi:hypothetical protein
MEEHYTDTREVICSELLEYIDSVCTACFPHEDPFEAIVIFLHTSIEVRFQNLHNAHLDSQHMCLSHWINKR